ncbi:hypothetical protein [Streptomyces hawaiiensis]|jgi:hypothetical protein|uniref:hypothetical protein n=1 Tax=Streptomyces hawaiiensis TaxID=67305 RepID=UPI003659B1B1
MMKQCVLRTAAVLGLVAVFCTACSGSGEDGRSARPSGSSAPPSSRPSVPTTAQVAEKVKNALEERISADEEKFGVGQKSPCTPASPQLFTVRCETAADATSDAADLALREIDGRAGFATLNAGARKIQAAARTYKSLGCATGPTAADVRRACLGPAAVIAQGFPDLRDGANLGLAGK